MKTLDILTGKCLTPEAIYKTSITDTQVKVTVDMSKSDIKELSSKNAKKLEDELHHAVEKVLAKYLY